MRRGAATVELALLLPFLVYMFVAVFDFSRVFSASVTIANCARQAAAWAADPNLADDSPFESAAEVVLADAANLSPPPTLTVREGFDTRGYGWVEVEVSHDFETVSVYPGIPSKLKLGHTVRMRKRPVEESP